MSNEITKIARYLEDTEEIHDGEYSGYVSGEFVTFQVGNARFIGRLEEARWWNSPCKVHVKKGVVTLGRSELYGKVE